MSEETCLIEEIGNEILEFYGIDKLLNSLNKIESSEILGYTVGYVINENYDKLIFSFLTSDRDINKKNFAVGYIKGKFNNKGMIWLKNIEKCNLNIEQKINILINLPLESSIWAIIDEWLKDYQDEYWSKVYQNPHTSKSNLLDIIENLLRVGRPLYAIECINANYEINGEYDTKIIIKTLLSDFSNEENINNHDVYKIRELIKILQNDDKVEVKVKEKIEWYYLNIFDYKNIHPKYLERKIAQSPNFFHENIKLIYKSKNSSKNEARTNNLNKNIAVNAYTLLNKCKVVPGYDNGKFYKEDFKEWLKEVKKICEKSGHLDVALTHIGHLLYYARPDKNGLWINEFIASILNEKNARRIRQGYATEAYNSRGVHWIDPSGKQEIKIAEKWKSKANIIEKKGYIRFATTLRELAEEYIEEHKKIVEENKKQ